jgi:hypothetical protein
MDRRKAEGLILAKLHDFSQSLAQAALFIKLAHQHQHLYQPSILHSILTFLRIGNLGYHVGTALWIASFVNSN